MNLMIQHTTGVGFALSFDNSVLGLRLCPGMLPMVLWLQVMLTMLVMLLISVGLHYLVSSRVLTEADLATITFTNVGGSACSYAIYEIHK